MTWLLAIGCSATADYNGGFPSSSGDNSSDVDTDDRDDSGPIDQPDSGRDSDPDTSADTGSSRDSVGDSAPDSAVDTGPDEDTGPGEDTAVDPPRDVPSWDCDADDLTGVPSDGWWSVPPLGELAPLCNGFVWVTDGDSNELVLYDVVTGAGVESYAMSDTPTQLALDSDYGVLYAGHAANVRMFRADLAAGTSSEVAIGGVVEDLAVAPDGEALALLSSSSYGNYDLAFVDSTGARLGSTEVDSDDFMVFAANESLLLTGDSGGDLGRWYVDFAALSATEDEDYNTSSVNGQGLVLSPDQQHLAFPNGGGNGSGYTIWDYNPIDFEDVYGEWDTGPYPRAAAFSPDSRLMAGSNGDEVYVFGVEDHVLLELLTPDTSCDYSTIDRLYFSRGGDVVYAYTDCGYDGTSGLLYWWDVSGVYAYL